MFMFMEFEYSGDVGSVVEDNSSNGKYYAMVFIMIIVILIGAYVLGTYTDFLVNKTQTIWNTPQELKTKNTHVQPDESIYLSLVTEYLDTNDRINLAQNDVEAAVDVYNQELAKDRLAKLLIKKNNIIEKYEMLSNMYGVPRLFPITLKSPVYIHQ